jgi:hypothetical protein
MSGLLDAYAAQADTGAANPLQVLPRTAGERWDAAMDAAMAPDRAANIGAARFEWYQKVIDQLHDQTGQTFLNPAADRVSNEELEKFGNKYDAFQDRLNKVITANRALRETNPDAINAEGIDQFIGVAGQAAREKAASYVGTGNGLAAFAAGMFAPQPENIVGLVMPGSRALTEAVPVVRSFMGGLGREALYQAGTMGALSAGTEALDTASRSQTGTAPSLSESVENVGASMLGGALFGGAFHAVHAGPAALFAHWQGLKPEVRDSAPLEVKDAMRVVEQEALYGDGNRLGIPWALHDQMQTDTLRSILTGTPVRPVDNPETAMTALSTILRQPTDRVSIEGLQGVLDRTAGMTDADLEGVARELKPQSFAAMDAVDQKLQALDQRVAAIRQEAEQIGPTDVIDMDTASILNDIESRLQQGGLRRAVRQQLEHERRQWLETLDVHGGLTNELQRMRTEFFPEHGPALQQIAQERAGLMQERTQAQQEAQREIDFLRSKLQQIRLAKPEEIPAHTADMGPPADLANALDRAEFNRNASIFREAIPARREAAPVRPVPTRESVPATAPATSAAPAPDVTGLLQAKPAKNIREALMQELEQHEIGVKEAAAIKACVGGGK